MAVAASIQKTPVMSMVRSDPSHGLAISTMPAKPTRTPANIKAFGFSVRRKSRVAIVVKSEIEPPRTPAMPEGRCAVPSAIAK
jgi:hypothetical protein